MGLWDNIKNIMTIPEEEEDDNLSAGQYEEEEREAPVEKKEPRIIKPRPAAKASAQTSGKGMQVVLVKPDRYQGINSAADHLNAGKTLVVNLENCDAENSRRIVDFLSGATYANGGTVSKVAKNTFIFVSSGVDILGEQVFDDIEEGNLFF